MLQMQAEGWRAQWSVAMQEEMEGRWRGDGGEMEGRCRRDVGDM